MSWRAARRRDTEIRRHRVAAGVVPSMADRWPHVCEICGKEFVGRKATKYCSLPCRKEAKKAHDIELCRRLANGLTEAQRASLKAREMRARLKERDAEARKALGEDAVGEVRGRIPGGSAGAQNIDYFARWR